MRRIVACAALAAACGGTNTGVLHLVVSGLPSGVSASVTVSPGGAAVTQTTDLALAAGTYTIAAASVTSGAQTFGATISPASTAQVYANQITAVTVAYGATTGTLVVTIEGVPAGAEAAVTVSGPGSFLQHPTATATYHVAPGVYTVSATSLTSGGYLYAATVTGSSATVAAGGTTNAGVAYAPSTGALTVTITPAGAGPDVLVTGPGLSQHLTSTRTIAPLTPGSYTLTPADYTQAGEVIRAAPSTVAVVAAQTASASAAYAQVTGDLSFTISGNTFGAVKVHVAGPGGYSSTQTGDTIATIKGLFAGDYVVTADDDTSTGAIYQPTITGSPAAVTAAGEASVTITYAQPAACSAREPAGATSPGWDFAALNAAFDYSAAPVLVKVATVPANGGTNVDGAVLLSNGDWAVLPNDSTGHVTRFSPTCEIVAQSGNVFDGAYITLAETKGGLVIGPADTGLFSLANDGSTASFYGSRATAVAQLPDGNVAALLDSGDVLELDATTGAQVTVLATGAPGAINLATGPDGSIFVAEFTGGTVWKAPPGGAFAKLGDTAPDGSDAIEGMTVLPDGQVLIADLNKNRVDRVDSTTGALISSIDTSAVSGSTRSLQLAPNGRVYLAGSSDLYRIEFPAK